jgi:hypothetical protein
MLIDNFIGCAHARSLDIAAQIKIIGEPSLVFSDVWFYLSLAVLSVRELTTLWAFPLHVYLYKNYNPNYKWEITTS